MPDVDLIGIIVDLAAARHVAVIDYRKPLEKSPSRRWAEPYKLVEAQSAFMIRTFQLRSEPINTGEGWRAFRTDRIQAVADSGQRFKPRTRITLDHGDVHPLRRPEEFPDLVQSSPVQVYSDYLTNAVMDGVLSGPEYNRALELQQNINPLRVRAAHAVVYSSLLTAMLVDGEISDREQQHLGAVRKCLGLLGWEP